MRRISRPGNEDSERGSALIDSAFAIAILCIGLAAACFAFGSMARGAAGNLDGFIAAIQERGSHEAEAFEAK
jgi:hypothetical protein